MRIIDRLYKYLEHCNLSPYTFERACGIANGYLKKQFKGGGSIGSDILEKIIATYKDLSLIWLVTGKGKMLNDQGYYQGTESGRLAEDTPDYTTQEHTIRLLMEKVSILENALADKEKIIKMLERRTG